jgi:hypothetical protein
MRQFGLGWNAPRTYALPGIFHMEDLRFFLYTFRKCTVDHCIILLWKRGSLELSYKEWISPLAEVLSQKSAKMSNFLISKMKNL